VEFLPESQRDILKMRIFKEMSFKDIAELEDISINTALGRMRYALINLRKMIEENDLVIHF
jgi:RNA polymerase sigma-70 factor (ECF subfamily)